MNIVEKLREITEGFGWKFFYGRKDFQNLVEADSEDDVKWYFFLDPITTDDTNPNIPIHSGYFMILSKSDLDQIYDGQKETDINNGKWRTNILPKRQFIKNEFRNAIECDGDLEVTASRVTDVINFFDENFDGILNSFSIKQYV